MTVTVLVIPHLASITFPAAFMIFYTVIITPVTYSLMRMYVNTFITRECNYTFPYAKRAALKFERGRLYSHWTAASFDLASKHVITPLKWAGSPASVPDVAPVCV